MLDRMEVFRTLNAMHEKPSKCAESGGMHEYLLAHGWKRLQNGSFKVTYGHDDADFVVKRIYWGDWKDGAREIFNALEAPGHLIHFLLPVWQGNGFQIQDRITERVCPDPDACMKFLEYVNDSGVGRTTPGHNHTHDETGIPVIYDYGQEYQWDSDTEDSCETSQAQCS